MRTELDQVVDIETPEQVVFSYTVAGIGSRAAAALIDHAIIYGALIGLGLLALWVFGSAFMADFSEAALEAGGWALALFLLLHFALQWGYYILFEALWDGQTPGKRWLRLRVVQDGGYSVSFAASAARNVARIIDMQPFPAYVVGLVAVAVSRTGKRVGDHVAGTFVVRESVVSADPLAPARPAAPTIAHEAVLTEDEVELLERFLSRASSLDPARRAQFAEQLSERFRSHLTETADPLEALRSLLLREREARAHGAGAAGETGAARERYALLLEGEPRWRRFAARLAEAQRHGLARMAAEEVAAFVAEYRSVATDLARLSTAARGREPGALFRLSRLVAGGHNLLYRQERLQWRATRRYLFVTVPAELRRSLTPILAAAVLFFGSGVASYVGVVRQPALIEEMLPPGIIDRAEQNAARVHTGDRRYIDVDDYARPILATSVIRNNVQVAFMAFASGMTAGILTVLLLLFNGVSIGSVLGLFQAKGVGGNIADFVIGHAVFELTAICIAAGAGFVIAAALLLPGACTRREALVIQGRRALRLLAAAALFLLIAGFIEGLISPRIDVPFAVKAAVAAVSALLVVGYWSMGRGAADAEETVEVTAYSEARALMAR